MLIILAVFLLAGFVKGVVGLGLPTIAMGLLTLGMPAAQAAALLVLPSLVTNLVQMRPAAAALALTRRLWPMLAGVALGTALGFFLWVGLGGRHAERALGLLLILYGALGLLAARPRLPERAGGLVGLATGAVTAATGVFVLPAVPWLQSLGLARDDLVRALGIAFTVSTLALATLLFAGREMGSPALLGSALAIIPALLGQRLGEAVRHRLSEAAFRRCFQLGLIALGLWLALRG
jgi:hypothetical protein